MNKFKIFGTHQDNTVAQMQRCMNDDKAAAGVLCADGHLGYAQPVGGVIAYPEHISVSGVGFDIGCGNMAVRLDTTYDQIKDNIGTILADVSKKVSFGVGQVNNTRVKHELFDSPVWKEVPEIKGFKNKAREQLGTVGSGNHYIDIFRDQNDHVWIGNHFGSRGLGHKTATTFLKLGGGKDGIDVDPCLLHQDSDLGQKYLAAMTLAGEYAYAGREWVVETVRNIIGGTVTDMVHNHHNFAWREEHMGHDMWVVRKGATPAFPGQRGFVGGSMADDAVILQGLDTHEAALSLYSTVHGAGRVMSRTEAKGRFVTEAVCTGEGCEHSMPWIDYEKARKAAGLKDGAHYSTCPYHSNSYSMKKQKNRQAGKVRHDDMQSLLKAKGVTLVGADLDEAPQAYRRLTDVLAAHNGTVEVQFILSPVGVIMAGNDTFDPYKD